MDDFSCVMEYPYRGFRPNDVIKNMTRRKEKAIPGYVKSCADNLQLACFKFPKNGYHA